MRERSDFFFILELFAAEKIERKKEKKLEARFCFFVAENDQEKFSNQFINYRRFA